MTSLPSAVASLMRRRVTQAFSSGDPDGMVKVTCLERDEIAALVPMLRGWKPSGATAPARIVVTATTAWSPLEPGDIPGEKETPTTFRNADAPVVFIVDQALADFNSLDKVATVSDGDLLTESADRKALVESLYGTEPPKLLTACLEEVYETIHDDDAVVSLRSWVRFVERVATAAASLRVADAASVWAAIGDALPAVHLFPDDELGKLARTDRFRRLRLNADESRRLHHDADERWRDERLDRAQQTTFLDSQENPEPNSDAIRRHVVRVLGSEGRSEQAHVLFRHWLQLAWRKVAAEGLGTRIQAHLASEHRTRLDEYEAHDVTTGLDESVPKDAQRLLDATPPDGLEALVALLPAPLARALERLAYPRTQTTSTPLSELLRVVYEMVSEREALLTGHADRPTGVLQLGLRRERAENLHSRSLFAWLFGPSLQTVIQSTANSTSSIEVCPSLLDLSALHGFERDDAATDESEGDTEGAFDPLELRLQWSDDIGRQRRIDWRPADTPGLAALWRVVARSDVSHWHGPAESSFEAWLEGARDRAPMLGGCPYPGAQPSVVCEWIDERRSAFADFQSNGLVPARLSEYADRYCRLLLRLRDQHRPSGSARADVASILRLDLFTADDASVLLASHPLRLRWVASYLARCTELLERALAGELRTNPTNPDRYFEELSDASPQSQPPLAVVGEQLHLAVREQDWHEHMAPLKDASGERRDWLADLDDGAIDDIADTVGRYLAAYPHKVDGLHVLYAVRAGGAGGLRRLVRQILRRIEDRNPSLTLTLIVDRREIRDVEEVLQEFDDPDHRAHSDRPPIQVRLRRWRDPDRTLPDVSDVPHDVDLAIVPNLFGASTRTQDATRDGRISTRPFDPLLDEPTTLEPVGDGTEASTAVSRVLLPDGRDGLLEAWSTVSTRQFRGTPIGEAPTEFDIDHVLVQVSLEKNRDFFDGLHGCAHWVINVDAFVGREQVEALQGGPDVIQVRTGIGANGAYRMVVSSSTGRSFVESRIARRLRQQIDSQALPDVEALAGTIYDWARLLVPGIVLRSLGLGRAAAEMVGLVIARHRLEQADPAYVGEHGFQSWVSLDEHQDWSGGNRADLARVRGRLDAGRLHLAVDVVEAKMRTQVVVSRADVQIKRSVELLEAALGAGPSDEAQAGVFADADMWRRLLWRALEQTSNAVDASPAATHVTTPDGPRAGLDERIRTAFRQGNIVVDGVSGILVSITDSEATADKETPAGYRWLRLTLDEVRDELLQLSSTNRYPLRSRDGEPSKPEAVVVDEVTVGSAVVDAPMNEASRQPRSAAPDSAAHRDPASERARRRLQELVDALHERNLDVTAAGEDDALEGPGFYLLRVRLGRGVRPQAVFALTDDLQYHLELEAGHTPRIYVDRGTVVVEIPKRSSERYYVEAEELWSRTEWPADRLYAPLGYDVRGTPVGVDFSSSRSPHLLVGGMTGGGKSVALDSLLLGIVNHYPPESVELRIIDPKGNEFTQFEDLEHVPTPPGSTPEDAIELLKRCCAEMDERYGLMKALSRHEKKRVQDIGAYNAMVSDPQRLKWILVVLDEFADLTADRDDKRQIEALLQRISQKARACGIHAIVATQKPSAEVISTTTRSNLGAQLALRVRSATDSRVIMEAPGAESLAGNGDAFLRLSGEEPIRLQCALAD